MPLPGGGGSGRVGVGKQFLPFPRGPTIKFHPCINDIGNRRDAVEKAIGQGRIDLSTAIGGYAWVNKDGQSLGKGQLASAVPTEASDRDSSIPFVITTLQEDRDGDIVVPMGMQLGDYTLNPIVFFGHQENPIPIAKATSPDGRLCVYPEENRVKAVAYFDDHDPDAMKIYDKVRRGFLNATSIAFVPIEAYRRDDVEKAHHDRESQMPKGWLFKQYTLTEFSVVGVPSNAGAIRDDLDTDKSGSPRLRKALGAYAAKSTNERGGCWSGWCPTPQGCKPCEKGTPMTIKKSAPRSGKGLRSMLNKSVKSPKTRKANELPPRDRDWGTDFPTSALNLTPSDKQRMEQTCPTELAAWRRAGEAHYDIPNANGRMENRRRYEQALDALRAAWQRAGKSKSCKCSGSCGRCKSVRKDWDMWLQAAAMVGGMVGGGVLYGLGTDVVNRLRTLYNGGKSPEQAAREVGLKKALGEGSAAAGGYTVPDAFGEACPFCGGAECDGTCEPTKVKTMARKPTKKQAAPAKRRKAAEPPVEEEAALEPEDQETKEEETPVKPSAMVAAKAYNHLKELGDYLGEARKTIDHPGMDKAFGEATDDVIPKAMQHFKDAVAEHHPDTDFEKACQKAWDEKSLEGTTDMPTGEANLVDRGETPEKQLGENVTAMNVFQDGGKWYVSQFIDGEYDGQEGPFNSRQEAQQNADKNRQRLKDFGDETVENDFEEVEDKAEHPNECWFCGGTGENNGRACESCGGTGIDEERGNLEKEPFAGEETAAEEAEEQEVLDAEEDPDIDEILERYQQPKHYRQKSTGKLFKRLVWSTRKAGPARVAAVLLKGGRIRTDGEGRKWLVAVGVAKAGKFKPNDNVVVLADETKWGGMTGTIVREVGSGYYEVWVGGDKARFDESELQKKSFRRKSVEDDGVTPAEAPPESLMKDEHREAISKAAKALDGMTAAHDMPEHHQAGLEAHAEKLKAAMDSGDMEAVGKAQRHMKALADAPDVPEHHKEALSHHAGELAKCMKDLGGDADHEPADEEKSVRKIDGSDCEGADNDDPECRAMFANVGKGRRKCNKFEGSEEETAKDLTSETDDLHGGAGGEGAGPHLTNEGNPEELKAEPGTLKYGDKVMTPDGPGTVYEVEIGGNDCLVDVGNKRTNYRVSDLKKKSAPKFAIQNKGGRFWDGERFTTRDKGLWYGSEAAASREAHAAKGSDRTARVVKAAVQKGGYPDVEVVRGRDVPEMITSGELDAWYAISRSAGRVLAGPLSDKSRCEQIAQRWKSFGSNKSVSTAVAQEFAAFRKEGRDLDRRLNQMLAPVLNGNRGAARLPGQQGTVI